MIGLFTSPFFMPAGARNNIAMRRRKLAIRLPINWPSAPLLIHLIARY